MPFFLEWRQQAPKSSPMRCPLINQSVNNCISGIYQCVYINGPQSLLTSSFLFLWKIIRYKTLKVHFEFEGIWQMFFLYWTYWRVLWSLFKFHRLSNCVIKPGFWYAVGVKYFSIWEYHVCFKPRIASNLEETQLGEKVCCQILKFNITVDMIDKPVHQKEMRQNSYCTKILFVVRNSRWFVFHLWPTVLKNVMIHYVFQHMDTLFDVNGISIPPNSLNSLKNLTLFKSYT